MQKQKVRQLSKFKSLSILILAIIFCLSALGSGLVVADSYQEQIDQINRENQHKLHKVSSLDVEASSLNDKIHKLQVKISAMQVKINENIVQAEKIQKQIVQVEAELIKQKKILGENIKTMYLEGQISTLEMLASSKDLSDFVDKQTYRNIVKDKITTALGKIRELKNELNANKEKLEKIIDEQKAIQSQLDAQKAESNRILSLNENQQNALNQQIEENYAQISELRRQQAIAYAAYSRKNGVSSYGVGEAGNGGYPSVWAYAPQDSLIDSWGMFNRECVSYVAWKVASTGRYMPYWGGRGHAYMWPQNARNARIPVDKNHSVGSVAVWDSFDGLGWLGHVAYVEASNSDGSIEVSQYNFVHGKFSRMHVPASDVGRLDFIHF